MVSGSLYSSTGMASVPGLFARADLEPLPPLSGVNRDIGDLNFLKLSEIGYDMGV